MINRFHNAAPSAAVLNANSSAGKTKATDDFGLLLNALAGPAPTQQQASGGLQEETKVKPELHNPAMLFERILDSAVEVADQSTSYLFLTASMPGSAAISRPQNLLSPLLVENHLPQVMSDAEITSLQIPSSSGNGNMPAAAYLPTISSDACPVQPQMILALSPIAALSESLLPAQPEMINATPAIGRALPNHASVQSAIAPEAVPNDAGIPDTTTIKPDVPDSSDTHATSSKYSRAPGADVELLTVPWRLQANAALSYQSTARRLQNSEDAKLVLNTPIQAALTNPGDQKPLSRIPGNAAAFESREMDKALQFYQVAEAASTLANAYENARIQRTDSRASFVMWPQRVLHWLADGDATTAWVRDYQLDANGTRTLVDALRCFAEQQGFSLRRIMLNGHEAWRAPSTF